MDEGAVRHANVVGLGLIGGSVSLALQREGFTVHGFDSDPNRLREAISRGVVADDELRRDAVLGVVATPVAQTVAAALDLLADMDGYVTDVGSTKGAISAHVTDGRFVPGHPMAGSELDGLDGADGSMFERAVWILTPTTATDDDAFEAVAEIVSKMGADVVTLSPNEHDELVAIVSHVPHLAATSLMRLASDESQESLALLRLAAGGFRDMTRIASGRPEIWIDICRQNRDAIVEGLGRFIATLEDVQRMVGAERNEELLEHLDNARRARLNLPSKVGPSNELAEIRIPIADRPGAAAEVFSLAAQLGTNVFDFEVVHSSEGDSGVLVMVIDNSQADLFRGGLLARSFRPAIQRLS